MLIMIGVIGFYVISEQEYEGSIILINGDPDDNCKYTIFLEGRIIANGELSPSEQINIDLEPLKAHNYLLTIVTNNHIFHFDYYPYTTHLADRTLIIIP